MWLAGAFVARRVVFINSWKRRLGPFSWLLFATQVMAVNYSRQKIQPPHFSISASVV